MAKMVTRSERRAAARGPRVKRSYDRHLVEPTPTILEILNTPQHPDHPALLKALGITEEQIKSEAQTRGISTDEARLRAVDAIRRGAPVKMGGTVTRYPDPGGVPNLSIQADDVSVRVGGMPIRNPTAASALSIAPAANAVLADTGALAAGTYLVEINLAASAVAAAGKHIQVEHRNAANAATVNYLGGCSGGQMFSTIVERVVVAAGERVRAVVGAVAFAASEGAIASIRAYRLDV
jgi:hypothetical protein